MPYSTPEKKTMSGLKKNEVRIIAIWDRSVLLPRRKSAEKAKGGGGFGVLWKN
jgi:hypothetical protein